jgi:hypothetical protein
MLLPLLLVIGALCVPAIARAGGDKICDVCVDDAITDTASSPGYVATARRLVFPGYHRNAVFVGKDHHVRFANFDAAGWSIEVVDPAARAGGLAMDFDDLQRPIACYHDSVGSVLFARRLAAGSWAIQMVAPLIGATGATSMAHIPGVTGIAFMVPNVDELFYAEQSNDGPWMIQPVAPLAPGSGDPSLLIDGPTRAISFRDGLQGVLRLATTSLGQPWTTQLVDASVAVGGSSSLIGHAGDYGIAYYDALNADLRYARSVPGGWAIDVVDGSGRRVGRSCAAVLLGSGPSDLVGIAYYDQSFGDLDYAAMPGPAWLHTWIDSQGDVGNTLSAGVGSFGAADTVSIVYTNRPAGDLLYLERAAAVVSVAPSAGPGELRASWNRDAAAAGGRVRFRMPASGEASVTILDPQGRRVAEPLHRVLAAGPAEVSWDGRDADGRRVGAGVYFARVVVPGAAAGLRGVILH